jgi:hypothetical protein
LSGCTVVREKAYEGTRNGMSQQGRLSGGGGETIAAPVPVRDAGSASVAEPPERWADVSRWRNGERRRLRCMTAKLLH